MSSETENMLEILSKDFLSAYKWLIYAKQKDIDWCIEHTNQIVGEAIYLRKLLSKQINSGIGKRLAKKCKEWYVYSKTYGIKNKKTTKRFRRLICGIADCDIENYHLVENFLFNDDGEDFYEKDLDDDNDDPGIARTNTRNRDVILGNIGNVQILRYYKNKKTSPSYPLVAAMTSMQTNNSQLKRTEVINNKAEKCGALKYLGQFSYASVRTELCKDDEICPLNDYQKVNTKNHENYVNMNIDTGAKGVDLQDNYDDEMKKHLEIQYERVYDEVCEKQVQDDYGAAAAPVIDTYDSPADSPVSNVDSFGRPAADSVQDTYVSPQADPVKCRQVAKQHEKEECCQVPCEECVEVPMQASMQVPERVCEQAAYSHQVWDPGIVCLCSTRILLDKR